MNQILPQPQDRCFLFHKDLLVQKQADQQMLSFLIQEVSHIESANFLEVGAWDGVRYWVIDSAEQFPEIPDPWFGVELRPLLAGLCPVAFHQLATAKHLLGWYKAHQFCSRCATPLLDSLTERARSCPNCGHIVYPVIAPAVIVAVKKGDTLLLARNKNFPGARHSVIAGFVEAGETLEQTVVREVREEVGIEVCNIRYVASQSWPFPNSLMLGFFADYASGEIQVDGQEIAFADWFRKDNLPEIPPKGSISRNLIDMSFEL